MHYIVCRPSSNYTFSEVTMQIKIKQGISTTTLKAKEFLEYLLLDIVKIMRV